MKRFSKYRDPNRSIQKWFTTIKTQGDGFKPIKRLRISILDLPDELLLRIASFVPTQNGQIGARRLYSLCLVSKAFARTGQEIMLEDCDLTTGHIDTPGSYVILDRFLRSVIDRPDLAHKVRTLHFTVGHHYAWTHNHRCWTDNSGHLIDTVSYMSESVRKCIPTYNHLQHTWLNQLRCRSNDSYAAVIAWLLLQFRGLLNLYVELENRADLPPLITALGSTTPPLILGSLKKLNVNRSHGPVSILGRQNSLLFFSSVRKLEVKVESLYHVACRPRSRHVGMSNLTSLVLRGTTYPGFNASFICCIKALRSFTLYSNANCNMMDLQAGLLTQSTSLEYLKLSVAMSQLIGPNPLGWLHSFGRLNTVHISQVRLLGDTKYRNSTSLLVNILPPSIERLELDVTWVQLDDRYRHPQLATALAECPPKLKHIHFYTFSKKDMDTMVRRTTFPVESYKCMFTREIHA
ncbi:hypothetical protein K432DRAFT_440253 [Lepidopterella palustris CBS 459.81]|uniref:F-box domain-containing protein n=1 Tax=Lepidopterella palustris CBS 459.81 TaxID=1314670 RepID=A0A8E2JJ11_9PEZI|nr:hypothetical protein K432DRAFT_440253 [Lepidopterella palustris CBS 459.81]